MAWSPPATPRPRHDERLPPWGSGERTPRGRIRARAHAASMRHPRLLQGCGGQPRCAPSLRGEGRGVLLPRIDAIVDIEPLPNRGCARTRTEMSRVYGASRSYVNGPASPAKMPAQSVAFEVHLLAGVGAPPASPAALLGVVPVARAPSPGGAIKIVWCLAISRAGALMFPSSK